ncbi:unnamed protein product [Oikopleura dioica]|uniref:mRNA guanylyltransferase n=1 Tax=Oikopleura dioica TaxID=34765 RepID=E4XDB3_OIKDI|nr:unnamed protein product [Oikopleura dioica]
MDFTETYEILVNVPKDGGSLILHCIGTACDVFLIEGLTFPRANSLDDHFTNVLLDGEMVLDLIDGEKVPRFLVFDVIQVGNERVGDYDFRTRSLFLQKRIFGPRQEAIEKGLINEQKQPFLLSQKESFEIGNTKHLVENGAFLSKIAHKTDGLIFQRASGKKAYYRNGRHRNWNNSSILKWKPQELNSIDFKLKLQYDAHQTQNLSKTQALLYVGGEDKPYGQMKFHEELIPLNNKIIECSYDFEEMSWVFIREREDKSWPNYVTVADSICKTIESPVTKNDLLQAPMIIQIINYNLQ